jgi:hypothetical protein
VIRLKDDGRDLAATALDSARQYEGEVVIKLWTDDGQFIAKVVAKPWQTLDEVLASLRLEDA